MQFLLGHIWLYISGPDSDEGVHSLGHFIKWFHETLDWRFRLGLRIVEEMRQIGRAHV